MNRTATRRISAGIAAAIVLTVPALTAAPASATRIVPGAELVDFCRDVRGFQSVYDVTYIGSKWRIDFSTARKWDCVRNPGAWADSRWWL